MFINIIFFVIIIFTMANIIVINYAIKTLLHVHEILNSKSKKI